ncbi:hypothetical protein [Aliikangiella sp. G2MR2-5]|uniref:hypothetical protein n=1 Tax=Aliikangiella sp. G2MR2-5 TaxID=2788943 RepID=UPI0018A8BEB6|nr:hypothetical protein [Aliikangiella sp. G2MR2-5]
MGNSKGVLLIATYGIDIFYGMEKELERLGCETTIVTQVELALSAINEKAFDAIIINMEPDGSGGIEGAQILEKISKSRLQANAICLGISVQSAAKLLASATKALEALSILVGWLNVPLAPEKACKLMLDMVASPDKFSVSARLK